MKAVHGEGEVYDVKTMAEELASARAHIAQLRAALERLCDEQNGPPLERRRAQYTEARELATSALASATSETLEAIRKAQKAGAVLLRDMSPTRISPPSYLVEEECSESLRAALASLERWFGKP